MSRVDGRASLRPLTSQPPPPHLARQSLALPSKIAARETGELRKTKRAGKTNLPGLCVGDPDSLYFTLRKNRVPDTGGTYGLVAPATAENGPVTLAADCRVPV